MMRLKSKLLSLNATKTDKVKVYSPRNCEELRIPFKSDKTAKVVGKLASLPSPWQDDGPGDQADSRLVSGVLVENDFKLSLMDPEDLREYAGLMTTMITCRQRLRLSAAAPDLIRWALEATFAGVRDLAAASEHKGAEHHEKGDAPDQTGDEPIATFLVMDCVQVRYYASKDVVVEWEGNMLNDGVADAIMALLLGVEGSPAAVKSEFNERICPGPQTSACFKPTLACRLELR